MLGPHSCDVVCDCRSTPSASLQERAVAWFGRLVDNTCSGAHPWGDIWVGFELTMIDSGALVAHSPDMYGQVGWWRETFVRRHLSRAVPVPLGVY